MTKTVFKFKPYPVWKSEQELRWLEDLASKGFRLKHSFNPFYFFEKAEPESVRYCHDFREVRRKDREEFFQLYSDAGWEHVSSWVGWHYFKSKSSSATALDKITSTENNAKFLQFVAKLYILGLVLCALLFTYLLNIGLPWERLIRQAILCIISLGGAGWLLVWASKRQYVNADKLRHNSGEAGKAE